MKPDNNIPGYPFDFDAIPRWVEPKLFAFDESVSWRRSKIIGLYALSCVVGSGCGFAVGVLVIGLIHEFSMKLAFTYFVIWVLSNSIIAPLYGSVVLWDFTKAKRRHEMESENAKDAAIGELNQSNNEN